MPAASTQDNVQIAGIKDGVAILKTGQYRIILEVAAINFSLKSEEEQNSLVMQYQGFINSLHFPIQIVVRSKKLDLSPYINNIKKIALNQTNELIRMQTEDYADFVSQLINLANIMKKTFYVVVGYDPLNISQVSFLDKIFKKDQAIGKIKISEEEFIHNTKELRQRAESVASGLGGLGLHCQQLGTKEIIELFYSIYNPEIAGKERLGNSEEFSSSFVTQATSENNDKPAVKQEEKAPEEHKEAAIIDNRGIVESTQKQKQAEQAISDPEVKKGEPSASDVPAETAKEEPAVQPVSGTAGQPATQAAPSAPDTANSAPSVQPNPAPVAAADDKVAQATPQITEEDESEKVDDPALNKNYGW